MTRLQTEQVLQLIRGAQVQLVPVVFAGAEWSARAVCRDQHQAAALVSRIHSTAGVQVEPLDEELARACGELCGAAGTADVIDASVVIAGRAHGGVIITSDPRDLYALDPRACLERI